MRAVARLLEDCLVQCWRDAWPRPLAARLALLHVVVAAGSGKARGTATAVTDALTSAGLDPEAVNALVACLDARKARGAAAGRDLVGAWDCAAAQGEPAPDGRPVGIDGAGATWMPRLGAIASTLPDDAAYRALGRTETGAAAQLLLLWIGGEVGHRAILMHWPAASAMSGVAVSTLCAGAACLEAAGWITREVGGGEPAAEARRLAITDANAGTVLRGVRRG